jgi:hypothetical protein
MLLLLVRRTGRKRLSGGGESTAPGPMTLRLSELFAERTRIEGTCVVD